MVIVGVASEMNDLFSKFPGINSSEKCNSKAELSQGIVGET